MVRSSVAIVCLGGLLIGALVLSCVAAYCTANPIVGPPQPEDTSFNVVEGPEGLAWLFVLNIIVNLFWICAIFFILGRYHGRSLGNLQDSPGMFLANIMGSAVIVTFIGAVVDYLLILRPDPGRMEGVLYFSYDLTYWLSALVLIFLSVFLSFRLLIGIRLVPAVTAGGAMAAMNLVWWVLSWEFGYDVPVLTIIFGVLALPILLRSLFYWYADFRAFPPPGTSAR